MQRFFIDTNILVDYIKVGKDPLPALLKDQAQKKADLFINPIVIAEFLNDTTLFNIPKLNQAKEFLSYFISINPDHQIAYKVAELLRQKQTSFMADAFIAATCLLNNLVLVTRNFKHFTTVKNLKIRKVEKKD